MNISYRVCIFTTYRMFRTLRMYFQVFTRYFFASFGGAGGRDFSSKPESFLFAIFFFSTLRNRKLTENCIFESTTVDSNFPIYFSSSFQGSVNCALESPCCFCLQKKMLNGARPFDIGHEAKMAHIKTLEMLLTLLHFLTLHTVLYLKQEYDILPFSIFSHLSREGRLKIPHTYWLHACDFPRDMGTLDLRKDSRVSVGVQPQHGLWFQFGCPSSHPPSAGPYEKISLVS